MNCRKHGYYLNVNGCPECHFPKALAILRASLRRKKK